MDKMAELKMTYSGLLVKDGKKIVRVCFERNKSDSAEGIVPNGTITSSTGFTEEEVHQLALYLQENAADIMNQAKEVHFLGEWLGRKK